MKKLLLLLLFVFSVNSFAQKITFQYDIAGNQITRSYCVSCRESNLPVKDFEDLQASDLQKFFPEDVISFYPNPVKNELYLEWQLIDNNKVSLIEINSSNGQLLQTHKSGFDNNKQVLSFGEYPAGIYFVNLTYANGEQKFIKIIKN